jgi:hypothetical protein
MAEGCDSRLTAEPVALHQVIGARPRSHDHLAVGECGMLAK